MNEEEFVAPARQHYQQIQDLQTVDSFYEYEQAFDHIWTDLGKEVLRQSISHPPADRRKKRQLTRYGTIEVSKAHGFSVPVNGFRISPYMQEHMVYAGQTDCYSQCNEILRMFLNIAVSVTQVQRVPGTYGIHVSIPLGAIKAITPIRFPIRKTSFNSSWCN